MKLKVRSVPCKNIGAALFNQTVFRFLDIQSALYYQAQVAFDLGERGDCTLHEPENMAQPGRLCSECSEVIYRKVNAFFIRASTGAKGGGRLGFPNPYPAALFHIYLSLRP